ncbi:MAG: hypothetical protein R2746_16830 [Acidimicrobiales bacterium]|nr:hypothetical protein [Actinomycetota bacterium]
MDQTHDDALPGPDVGPGTGPYRIELAGRAGRRVLAPFEGDFAVERTPDRTILRGRVRDPAHLHGVVARLTSMGVAIISFAPDQPLPPPEGPVAAR